VLADRGITQKVKSYMLLGDYRQSNPPAAIVRAVAEGDVCSGFRGERTRIIACRIHAIIITLRSFAHSDSLRAQTRQ
jgi:hypothetical protein